MVVDLPWSEPSIDNLYTVDVGAKTREERSRLLDQIEEMIALLEYCQTEYKPNSIGRICITQKLLAMRAKHFEVSLSFYPKFFGCIHVGVHE